jgi:lysophospholipase L1-like esterase
MNAGDRMNNKDQGSIDRGRDWAHHLARQAAMPQALLAGPSGHLLAMGDSWFKYLPPYDALTVLRVKYGYTVHSVAVAGDKLAQMLPPPNWNPQQPGSATGAGGQFEALMQVMATLPEAQKAAMKAILISGGGNDFAGDAKKLASVLNRADFGAPHLIESVLVQVVDTDLRNTLVQVLAATTEIAQYYFHRDVPIVIHGYSYPVPDGRPALNTRWLKPVFESKGYKDLQVTTDIMQALIDRLNTMQLSVLAQNPAFAHVKHADVRPALKNTLANDEYKKWWQNELHPTIPTGFIAVADKLQDVLNTIPSTTAAAAPAASATASPGRKKQSTHGRRAPAHPR